MTVLAVLNQMVTPSCVVGLAILAFFSAEICNAIVITADAIAEWCAGLASGVLASPDIAEDIRDRTKEDADEAVLTKNRRRNSGCTYYHATSKATASQLVCLSALCGLASLEGSRWEGGYVFVWKHKPDKKH